MKRLIIAGLILASFQTQAVVVVAAASSAATAANIAAQNAQRNAQISSQQSLPIDFPKDAVPDAQYGFLTCGKRTGETVGNTGCLVDTDPSAWTVSNVEIPYKDWPRKVLGIQEYTVTGVQFDHYNDVATIYFEYR